jgi:hypothetical protein
MGKQLSRALETRPSVSGTHFKNARVARRVARAGLTTGGSSDDTMDDLRLKPFLRRLSWPLFLFLSLVLWILALRSDILFSYPPHLRSGPCNLQSHAVLPKPPSLCTHPICTPQSHSHDTHTYYTVYTTHASILFCIHTFFFFILLYQSRAISICAPPFFIPRLFRSLCPNSICLLLPLLSYCLSFTLLLLWSLVRSVLSFYLSTSSSRHYLLSGIAIIWII